MSVKSEKRQEKVAKAKSPPRLVKDDGTTTSTDLEYQTDHSVGSLLDACLVAQKLSPKT